MANWQSWPHESLRLQSLFHPFVNCQSKVRAVIVTKTYPCWFGLVVCFRYRLESESIEI